MEAVAAEWACMFLSTVAFLAVVTHGCVTVNARIQYTLVVVVYDRFRFVHAAVTYRDSVSVEYFIELVVFREPFGH